LHSVGARGLEAAAAIIAAQDKAPADDPNAALNAILELATEYTTVRFERYFPQLACLALQAVTDVCDKHTLNTIVYNLGGPRLYSSAEIKGLFEDFEKSRKTTSESPEREETAHVATITGSS